MHSSLVKKNEALRLRTEERLSIKEISKKLNISSDTASRWLKNFKLNPEELYKRAFENAIKIVKTRNKPKIYTSSCLACGKDFSHIKRNSKYCSSRCRAKNNYYIRKNRAKSVVSWRQRTKNKAIEYKGGKCLVCGYNKCSGALDFHHVDPKEKDFSISKVTKGWDKVKDELDKCVLLCSNCHREVHHGILDLKKFIEA